MCVGESEGVRVSLISVDNFCASIARAAIEVCVREIERASKWISDSKCVCERESERVRVSLVPIDVFGASVVRAAIEVYARERQRERISGWVGV